MIECFGICSQNCSAFQNGKCILDAKKAETKNDFELYEEDEIGIKGGEVGMTIKEAVELYNKNKEEIAELKRIQTRIVSENYEFMKDPMAYYRVNSEDMNLFANLLSERVKRLEAELEQELE